MREQALRMSVGKSVPGRERSKFEGSETGVKAVTESSEAGQSKQGGSDVREGSRDQVPWKLVDRNKDAGFYSE